MHEAKSSLSELVRVVTEGSENEIVICRAGEPVAKIVPITKPQKRQLGFDKGLIQIAADFDSVDSEIAELFES